MFRLISSRTVHHVDDVLERQELEQVGALVAWLRSTQPVPPCHDDARWIGHLYPATGGTVDRVVYEAVTRHAQHADRQALEEELRRGL